MEKVKVIHTLLVVTDNSKTLEFVQGYSFDRVLCDIGVSGVVQERLKTMQRPTHNIEAMAKFCPKCGKEFDFGQDYCPGCGRKRGSC